mmetsp:Transcript_104996/g.338572  ORF Transcript_104996/g.338572 Transcript_104996/m.338572 type:complete len:316 (+) Transcript_104996:624-1571(+)
MQRDAARAPGLREDELQVLQREALREAAGDEEARHVHELRVPPLVLHDQRLEGGPRQRAHHEAVGGRRRELPRALPLLQRQAVEQRGLAGVGGAHDVKRGRRVLVLQQLRDGLDALLPVAGDGEDVREPHPEPRLLRLAHDPAADARHVHVLGQQVDLVGDDAHAHALLALERPPQELQQLEGGAEVEDVHDGEDAGRGHGLQRADEHLPEAVGRELVADRRAEGRAEGLVAVVVVPEAPAPLAHLLVALLLLLDLGHAVVDGRDERHPRALDEGPVEDPAAAVGQAEVGPGVRAPVDLRDLENFPDAKALTLEL